MIPYSCGYYMLQSFPNVNIYALRFKLDPGQVLDQIVVARAHNSEMQAELLAEAAALMVEDRYVRCVLF
jgi:Rad51